MYTLYIKGEPFYLTLNPDTMWMASHLMDVLMATFIDFFSILKQTFMADFNIMFFEIIGTSFQFEVM